MNLQTTKPRARQVMKWGMLMWRVKFKGWHPNFYAKSLDHALGIAYRCRLARITGLRDA